MNNPTELKLSNLEARIQALEAQGMAEAQQSPALEASHNQEQPAKIVSRQDLLDLSKRMEGLFLDWMVFTADFGARHGVQMNLEVMKYLKQTVEGLVEVMDSAVNGIRD